MSIALGEKEVNSIYYIDGNGTEYVVQAAYKGEDEVFTYGSVIDLGVATSFDISKYYEKYTELTVDDFVIVKGDTSISIHDSGHCPGWTYDPPRDPGDCHGTNERASTSLRFTKTYDNTTGTLTIWHGGPRGERFPVNVYMIPDFLRAVERNKIKEFNLTYTDGNWIFDAKTLFPEGSEKYKELTINNFAYSTSYNKGDSVDCWAYHCPIWVIVDIQYDAETGIVTMQLDPGRDHPYPISSQTAGVGYYIPTKYIKPAKLL